MRGVRGLNIRGISGGYVGECSTVFQGFGIRVLSVGLVGIWNMGQYFSFWGLGNGVPFVANFFFFDTQCRLQLAAACNAPYVGKSRIYRQ